MKDVKHLVSGQLWSGAFCPNCTAQMDGFTGIEGKAPSPGDFSVCAYCSSPLRFTDELRLRAATPEDLEQLEPEGRKMLGLIRKASKDMGLGPPHLRKKARQ